MYAYKFLQNYKTTEIFFNKENFSLNLKEDV